MRRINIPEAYKFRIEDLLNCVRGDSYKGDIINNFHSFECMVRRFMVKVELYEMGVRETYE